MNDFLLAGGKFTPELHLKQPGFSYSACGPFTKNKERIQKFEKTGYTKYICRNELDKACKDLRKRTAADKVLRNKAFNIAKGPKYDGYQRGLSSVVYTFFDKKTAGSRIKSMPQNEQLAEGLHKPIIRKFKKRKVYSAFKDSLWGEDLADIQLISKFNKRFRFLLCAIDIF